MKPGHILLKWNALGELEAKFSLDLTADNKKLAIGILTDAIKAILNTGTPLEIELGKAPVRLFGGPN